MKKKTNSFLVFTGVAAQMGTTIFLGAYCGKLLDEKYPMEKKWFTIGLTLFGVFLALYNVMRQLKRINEKNDKQNESNG